MINEAVICMSTLNAFAGKLMNEFSVHAATDITGFGLLGHLSEMCQASQLTAEINYNSIPFLNDVQSLAKSGNISSGTKRNLDYATQFTSFNKTMHMEEKLMIADAQTSGGLLLSVEKSKSKKLIDEINSIETFFAKKIENRCRRILRSFFFRGKRFPFFGKKKEPKFSPQ